VKNLRTMGRVVWSRTRRHSAVIIVGVLVIGCSFADVKLAAGSSNAVKSKSPSSIQTLTLGAIPDLQADLPLSVGQELAIFSKYGIKLNMVSLTTGPALLAALASGSVDISSVITPPLLGNAIQKGQNLALFCGQIESTTTDLLVSPGSTVRTYKQVENWKRVLSGLKGKTVGVPVLGTGAVLTLQADFALAGLTPHDVTFVAVGSQEGAEAALETGKVDAIFSTPFTTQTLIGTGKAKMLVSLGEVSPLNRNFFGAGFVAQRSWIESHRSVAGHFCEAYQASVDAIPAQKNRKVVKKLLVGTYGVPSNQIASAVGAVSALGTTINSAQLNASIKTSVQYGLLPPSPPLSYKNMVLLPK
jgi:NitT/TauT family transport system substrate-binding protein